MTPDQQFYLAMAGLILTSLASLVGVVLTFFKAGQGVQQAAVATQAAQAAVAVAVETSKKTDTANDKLTEIHALTNSTLSKTTASLEVALAKIEGLQSMVASLAEAKVVADKVAENLAGVAAVASTAPTAPTAPTEVVASEPMPVKIVAAVPVPVETEGGRSSQKSPTPHSL